MFCFVYFLMLYYCVCTYIYRIYTDHLIEINTCCLGLAQKIIYFVLKYNLYNLEHFVSAFVK